MPVLKATGLKKTFDDIIAVDGIDLEVSPGEIFGLIGPDGAGKTTALRLLVGVLDADEGKTFIDGIDIDKEPDKAREVMGYMPQSYSLYADLTVAENLRFFADMYFVPKKERDERLERLYEFSRLGPYADRRAGQLSGGMYKKLALSCNMIHTPKLLLLDEPTTGVDPISRRELWEILYAFASEGVAIVVSTPYMDEAERCHRIGLMSEGKFLIEDEPKNILKNFKEGVFEVFAKNQELALDKLKDVESVIRAYPVGGILKIICGGGVKKEALEDVLIKADVKFTSVEKSKPNFEDVFLSS